MPPKSYSLIGKGNILSSWVVKRSFLKKITKGGTIANCQQSIDGDIDQPEPRWLILSQILQNLPGKGIASFSGNINGKDVVVKAQTLDEAKHEYDFVDILKDIPGFIQYECFFTCEGNKETIEKFATVTEKTKLCTQKGTGMGVIVMPYYKQGSLELYLRQNTKSKEAVKQILIAVIKNLYTAYARVKFTHGDCFAKNIVLSDALEPIIIDFERSQISGSKVQFWRDIDSLFGDIARYILPELNDISRVLFVHLAYGTEPNDQNIHDICEKISRVQTM